MSNNQDYHRSDKVYANKSLFDHLIKELERRSGFEFEEFISVLLTKKYGPTKWPPRDGSDGKIDFASDKRLFQIYGSENLRGSLEYVRKKLSEIGHMKKNAKDSGLRASNIIFLTNIRPNEKMAKIILKSQNQKIQIKDIYQTAEFLYDVYYPFDLLASYHNSKCEMFAKESWPYDIDENTFVENFEFLFGSILARKTLVDNGSCLSFICEKILMGPVICVGLYGMGKTTIAKMLFRKWDYLSTSLYPVYITLTHRLLSNFQVDGLRKEIANEIKLHI